MIAAIIQARVNSTRLPRKVLLRADGKTFLEHMIARVKRSKTVERIIVAATTRREDRRIARIAERCGVRVFCGSESDVLDRYYQAARAHGVDIVVRLTGDCPVLDSAVIDTVVRRFVRNRRRFDYVSNVHPPTFPDGMDVEVFSFAALERAWREAERPSEREHVTSYIASHPNRFRSGNVARRSDLSALRLCLDEPADAVFLRRLIREFRATHRGTFGLPEILKLRKRQPALFDINRHITRNEGYLKSLREKGAGGAHKGPLPRHGSHTVIAILGGSLVQEEGRWRTTRFSDVGGLGDRLRIEAAARMYRAAPRPPVLVVLGGRGTLGKSAPPVAEVMRRELSELGVLRSHIALERDSGNTYEQLRALVFLLPGTRDTRVLLISNRYHLPRIRAFVAHAPHLTRLRALSAEKRLRLVSAEQTLSAHAPKAWTQSIVRAYRSPALRRRLARERRGVRDIKTGTYQYVAERSFSMRQATRRDARFLFDLRNEPEVRRLSLHWKPFSYEAHLSWLNRKLAEKRSALFIVESAGRSIGQVRYDIRQELPAEAEVSIALAAAFRGKGYGHRVLHAATEKFFSLFPGVGTVYAYINLGNERSARSFAKAGYHTCGISRRGGRARREMAALRPSRFRRHTHRQS